MTLTMSADVTEADFESVAERALLSLRDALDALSLDCEIELAMGILSIEFADGAKYIINSHRAARQIWMAAELTAWHFDPEADGTWKAKKSGDELRSALGSVLTKKLGRPVSIVPA